jgi:hypothetical protein
MPSQGSSGSSGSIASAYETSSSSSLAALSHQPPKEIPFSVNFAISCFSTIISRTLTHPFDTLKTNFQNKSIPFHLYQGLVPTLVLSAPGMGIYLASYDYCKEFLRHYGIEKGSFLNASLSGTFAEALSGVCFVPMVGVKVLDP